MKRPSRKIVRQISTAALGLISVVALLLSTGLIMYSDTKAFEPPGTNVVQPFPPIEGDEEIIGADTPPLAVPADGSSTAVLVASLLIVLAFVLVWFLVFRQESSEP